MLRMRMFQLLNDLFFHQILMANFIKYDLIVFKFGHTYTKIFLKF